MVIEIIADGIRIGTVTRCGPGIVIARLPNGEPLGQLGNIDAAVLALASRVSADQTSGARQHHKC